MIRLRRGSLDFVVFENLDQQFFRILGSQLPAMEAPSSRPNLLTIIRDFSLEGVISACMDSDVFIVLISQTNPAAHAGCRRRERRFFLRLEHGQWVYRDRVRGLLPPET